MSRMDNSSGAQQQDKSKISQSCSEKSMDILPDDLTSICRLCASKTDEMFPIFDAAGIERETAKQIHDCLPIVVRNIDVVSKLICRLCKENLQRFHDFRSNVLKANEKFKKSESTRKLRSVDESLLDLLPGEDVEEHQNYIDRESNNIICKVCSISNEVLLEGTPSAERFGNSEESTVTLKQKYREIVLNSMYKCEFCDRCYADIKSVNNHKATHTGGKPYVCLKCDIHYSTYKQVTAHKADHQNSSNATTLPKYFSCRHCDKTFMHYTNMNNHQKSCLSSNQRKCRHCGNCFADSQGLIEHKMSEVNKKWQCQKCPMSFGSSCALRLHKKKPHAKQFACSDCGKEFLQKTQLAVHLRSHTGEKPYSCDLCDKVYKIKSERDNHRKTHTGERPYKCTLCEKSFANSARLRDHTKFHKDPKPFKCIVCDKGFKRFSARKIHMTIHTGEKAFKCDVCEKAFKRKTDMRKHKKTRHEVSCRTVNT